MGSNWSWESSWRRRALGVRLEDVFLVLVLCTIGDRDLDRVFRDSFSTLKGVSFTRGVRFFGSLTSLLLSES